MDRIKLSETIIQEKEEQTSETGTQETVIEEQIPELLVGAEKLPESTDKKIDTIVRQRIALFTTMKNQKKTEIQQMAIEIDALPGVITERVAHIIVWRFRNLGYKMTKSYIYNILDDKYKDFVKVEQARKQAEERKEQGYDGIKKGPFQPQNYTIEELKADGISPASIKRVAEYLHDTRVRNEAVITSKERMVVDKDRIIAEKDRIIAEKDKTIIALTEENTVLKARIRELESKQ